MENIHPTPVNQLRLYMKADKIKVRICRIWKSMIPGTVQRYIALHCVFVNKAQHAVEGCTSNGDHDVMASKIEASGCYEIMDFWTVKIRAQYKVVPHETLILFSSKTVFRKLVSVLPPIPCHRFFLQYYNTLYPRLNNVDILTNVIGHISTVQPLESKQINQRIAYKCDVRIENIRKEEVMVTLWGDIGEAFSSLSMDAFSLPVVVFTSLKVKLYFVFLKTYFWLIYFDKIALNSTGSSLFFIDPDIPEVNAYKSVFSDYTESSKQANEDEILQTAKGLRLMN
ncbi:hypothetical protein DVH24_021290 [Malus domestica]|uniref:Replication protein A OB domain-containing protein n=1 Tax=Malus domestica TaxID=3750 RepID=A0A498HTN5_MALDO|nr:hypothetical protein DVH24_021290 [Malus domestica]